MTKKSDEPETDFKEPDPMNPDHAIASPDVEEEDSDD